MPGKGGRARRWRSDADRVRAFRARERGDDEPPTIEVALESGDEAAAAWNQVRKLGDTIDALKAELKTTQAALRRTEKELEREQARSNWISETNDRLRAELDDAERDSADLRERLAELVYTGAPTYTDRRTGSRTKPSTAPPGRTRTASTDLTTTTHPTTHTTTGSDRTRGW